jgi:hypothetical protein
MRGLFFIEELGLMGKVSEKILVMGGEISSAKRFDEGSAAHRNWAVIGFLGAWQSVLFHRKPGIRTHFHRA